MFNFDFHFNICELAKHYHSSFSLSTSHSITSFTFVHFDVCGHILITSLFGLCYCGTFVDDFSRATWTTWIYLLKSKNECFSMFKLFYKLVKTQFDTKLKVFCSDNGEEYMFNIFSSYISQCGIFHHTTCLGTPEQMESLRDRTVIFSTLFVPCYSICIFSKFSRLEPFRLLLFL